MAGADAGDSAASDTSAPSAMWRAIRKFAMVRLLSTGNPSSRNPSRASSPRGSPSTGGSPSTSAVAKFVIESPKRSRSNHSSPKTLDAAARRQLAIDERERLKRLHLGNVHKLEKAEIVTEARHLSPSAHARPHSAESTHGSSGNDKEEAKRQPFDMWRLVRKFAAVHTHFSGAPRRASHRRSTSVGDIDTKRTTIDFPTVAEEDFGEFSPLTRRFKEDIAKRERERPDRHKIADDQTLAYIEKMNIGRRGSAKAMAIKFSAASKFRRSGGGKSVSSKTTASAAMKSQGDEEVERQLKLRMADKHMLAFVHSMSVKHNHEHNSVDEKRQPSLVKRVIMSNATKALSPRARSPRARPLRSPRFSGDGAGLSPLPKKSFKESDEHERERRRKISELQTLAYIEKMSRQRRASEGVVIHDDNFEEKADNESTNFTSNPPTTTVGAAKSLDSALDAMAAAQSAETETKETEEEARARRMREADEQMLAFATKMSFTGVQQAQLKSLRRRHVPAASAVPGRRARTRKSKSSLPSIARGKATKLKTVKTFESRPKQKPRKAPPKKLPSPTDRPLGAREEGVLARMNNTSSKANTRGNRSVSKGTVKHGNPKHISTRSSGVAGTTKKKTTKSKNKKKDRLPSLTGNRNTKQRSGKEALQHEEVSL